MKVMFFSHSGGLGGSERSLLALIDELIVKKVECFIVVPYDGPLLTQMQKRNLPYAIVDYAWWCDGQPITSYHATQRSMHSLKQLTLAQENLDAWNADLVVTNSITIPWGALYSRLSHKPHILHVREFGELDFGLKFFSGYEASMKFLCQNSEYVFTNSKATLKHFQTFIPRAKSDYAYPSVIIPPLDEIKILGQAFHNQSAHKLIVNGAVTPGKGQMDAVEAVALLKDQNVICELILMGSLADASYVQQLHERVNELGLQNMVRFTEFLNNPLSYIQQADIVLVCSRDEAFGRATLEAMALRKIVIGTNSGGTKELIKDGESGFLYEPGNVQQLAQKILATTDRESEMEIISKNAREVYEKLQLHTQHGEKIYRVLVRTLLATQMLPTGTGLSRTDENALALLGLFSPAMHKTWADLKRSLVSNKILLQLNPQALSDRLLRQIN